VLMYASDYPHGESHFPKSTGIVLGVGHARRAQAQAVVGQRLPALRPRGVELTIY